MRYPVLICREGNVYEAAVVDLPECVGTGQTIADALERVGKAIENYFAKVDETDGTIPQPPTLAKVMHDPEIAHKVDDGAMLATVTFEHEHGRVHLPQVVFDKSLLAAIDTAAERQHITREKWLEAAVLEKLNRGV